MTRIVYLCGQNTMTESKIYYTIAEVSQATGLPLSTLRYWEAQFEELRPRRTAQRSNRYYTEDDIALVKRIQYIRDTLHITRIDAIRAELNRNKRNTDVRQRATEILLRARNELEQLRAEI